MNDNEMTHFPLQAMWNRKKKKEVKWVFEAVLLLIVFSALTGIVMEYLSFPHP